MTVHDNLGDHHLDGGIALALGKAAAPSAVGALRAYGKKKYDQFIALYTSLFDNYLGLTRDKCSQVKTLLNSDVALDLDRIYVNLEFSQGEQEDLTDASIVERVQQGTECFVAMGLAGSGKSMFMRWAALRFLENIRSHQKIPLFLEIRDLDQSLWEKPLDEAVFQHCSTAAGKGSLDQFRIGLRAGLFIILLDGVDETPVEKLEMFLTQIKTFRQTYKECSILASVRPGTQLPNITSFKVLRVQPMKLGQVIDVLKKAPYNEDRKELLIKALKDGLYKKHQSFLSNPLLVAIMLITFDDATRVPSNITTFYSEAFDALFRRHDWAKGIYVRKRHTNLEIGEFENVFRNLCYVSYFRKDYSFKRKEIIELIGDSMRLAGINENAESFLQDCIISVCLLLVDEPNITFVHRSFQEYFAASFISRYSGPKFARMMDFVAARDLIDNTFVMVCQLNRQGVIRKWAIPAAEAILSEINGIRTESSNSIRDFYEYLGISDIGVNLLSGQVTKITWGNTPNYMRIRSIAGLGSGSQDDNTLWIPARMFPEGRYGSLAPDIRRVLRFDADDSNQAEFDVSRIDSSWLEKTELFASMDTWIEKIQGAVLSMQEELAREDEFAELVDLVEPFEIGDQ